MNKIEVDVLDRGWIIELMSNGSSTYDIAVNYKLTEDIILECTDILEKEVLIQGLSFSEDFIEKALQLEYFNLEDIKDLSMTTYANMSSDFISKYKEYINWNRMILYISTQSDSFEDHVDIINDKNLWQVISANDLPTEFIRQWKDKLDWSFLSMVKCFTDDEKQEFSDYILIPTQEESNGEPLINPEDLKFLNKMSDEELEQLIEEINKIRYKDFGK